MNSLLVVGTILSAGFVAGELAEFLRLPRVTGYIVCGLLLNPGLFHPMPRNFVEHTDLVTHIALAFITFSVGGTLLASRIKSLGRSILWITVLEAEGALLLVFLSFVLAFTLFGASPNSSMAQSAVAASLLVGCLASPTDPTATLAVIHEYKAKGPVATTIMGVAALDDVFGIVNFSLATAVGQMLLTDRELDFLGSVFGPLVGIIGGVAVGIVFGGLLNLSSRVIKRETEKALIVLIFGLLALCYGTAEQLSFDPLLATMTMGCVVVNFNRNQEEIFAILERYTEELVFVLFFTLSGMRLDIALLQGVYGLIALFVVMRAAGKLLGAASGAIIGGSPPTVRKYAFLGLLPQGGVVIGLTLALQYKEGLSAFANSVLAVVVGATIIHEIIGPMASRMAFRRSGEIGN
jgi:Kef-type K+ transport system membrane component KefB